LFGITPDILIADNGALARYGGRDLYKKMIPCAAVNALRSRFGLVRCVSTENAYYLSGEYANDHWSIGKKSTVITDFSEELEDDAFYIDGNPGELFLPLPISELSECYPGVRAVAYSDVSLITVVHREATKLNALLAAGNALNIDIGCIAAFGDDYSDIEILSDCGVGVAVANAIEECKAAADYICGANVHDGVAKWIEENLFPV
jgi:hydroxymethylpyrimidine pyrophosphatase-like HAD family hydrolase